jgi:hypothetical protein
VTSDSLFIQCFQGGAKHIALRNKIKADKTTDR